MIYAFFSPHIRIIGLKFYYSYEVSQYPLSRIQLSRYPILTSSYFFPKRYKQKIDQSWAQALSDFIFIRINKHIFAQLHSEKTNPCLNAPSNVIVVALLLKDFSKLTDEEIDYKYKYTLHRSSFKDQSIIEQSPSRFRSHILSPTS